MELSTPELVYFRAQGLHITEKCNGCGKLLNQTIRYTIAGKPEVYCSAGCRDLTFFGDTREAKKRSTPGKCVYCGGQRACAVAAGNEAREPGGGAGDRSPAVRL